MQFDTSSPIWMQLVDEFSRRIVTGEWAAGSKMPGVRELAADMGVNPNTAQRALAELERREMCRSERATGRFVTDSETRIDEIRAELASGAADEFVRRVRGLKMAQPQARALLDERWHDEKWHSERRNHEGRHGDDHHTTEVPDQGGA